MGVDMVFTLTGPDRVGIVEEVTRVLLGLGGNAETSRMVRLGGQFAIIMLVTLPGDDPAPIREAFASLAGEGYKITSEPAGSWAPGVEAGWLPYRIEVTGADHEGIIHEIAAGLSHLGINIESAETSTVPSPISGAPLFAMTALVVVPAALDKSEWIAALEEAADDSNVNVHVSVADAL